MVNLVCLKICSIILSGVSHFLTVWRFDCCKVFHFAPLFCFTFYHTALLCMSFSRSCLSHDSTVTTEQGPVPLPSNCLYFKSS